MTWGNKQFGDLSLNIYENYYYLPLNFQDIDLIIAKVDFNSTPTSSNEFNGFIKKCGFIDKID
jgi:hypothetical protein